MRRWKFGAGPCYTLSKRPDQANDIPLVDDESRQMTVREQKHAHAFLKSRTIALQIGKVFNMAEVWV